MDSQKSHQIAADDADIDTNESSFSTVSASNNNNMPMQQQEQQQQQLCVLAEQHLKRFTGLMHAQLLLIIMTTVAILVLLNSYRKSRLVLHQNFLILFANIVTASFMYCLTAAGYYLREEILLWFYKDPCELLHPLWMNALLIGPHFMYGQVYPALHFCLMLERIRATVMAHKYEREGPRLTIYMVACSWLISLAFMAFMVVTAYMDPAMTTKSHPYPALSSKYSAVPAFVLSILVLPVVILTALCDWRITLLNNRQRKISLAFANYSLSRNFQLRENVLTMRLILPLDVSYALLYSLNAAFIIVLRALRSSNQLSDPDYFFAYHLANTVLFFYIAVTMAVYIRFIRHMNRRDHKKRQIFGGGDQIPLSEQAKIHFKQLDAHWN